MRTKKTVFGLFMILSFLIISCSTSKRTAVSCSEFSVYKNSKTAFNKGKPKYNILTNHQKTTRINHSFFVSKKTRFNNIAILNNSASGNKRSNTVTGELTHIDKIEYSKGLLASSQNIRVPVARIKWPATLINSTLPDEQTGGNQPASCDTILLKSGSSILCKIDEIGLNEIKYRKCDYLDGPVITISKSDIAAINYSNGTSENIISSNQNAFYSSEAISGNKPKQTEGLGFVGFIASLVGLFVASIPLGLVAIIFGAISLGKHKRNPGRYNGKWLATTCLILGFIEVVGMIALLSAIR